MDYSFQGIFYTDRIVHTMAFVTQAVWEKEINLFMMMPTCCISIIPPCGDESMMGMFWQIYPKTSDTSLMVLQQQTTKNSGIRVTNLSLDSLVEFLSVSSSKFKPVTETQHYKQNI